MPDISSKVPRNRYLTRNIPKAHYIVLLADEGDALSMSLSGVNYLKGKVGFIIM